MTVLSYPYLFEGIVVHGFNRGSKELGIPTANLDSECVGRVAETGPSATGIYYGWARVLPTDAAYPMVMSFGWNPHFANKERSVEVHLINVLLEPFYGKSLRFVISGYLRPEKSYSCTDDLIQDIHHDISNACYLLKSNKDASLLK